MTPTADWIATVGGVVGAVTGCAALGRILVTHGADRAQLKRNTDWISEDGVPRSDFDNIERRMEDAAAKADLNNLARRVEDAATKGDVANLSRRVEAVEGDMSEFAKLLTEIRVELGQIPGLKELVNLQFENMNHRINGVKQVLEAMADGRLPRRT